MNFLISDAAEDSAVDSAVTTLGGWTAGLGLKPGMIVGSWTVDVGIDETEVGVMVVVETQSAELSRVAAAAAGPCGCGCLLETAGRLFDVKVSHCISSCAMDFVSPNRRNC